MAQHKVGDKYLNDEEYALHTFEVWSFWLFVLGAVIVGTIALNHVPSDWSKELRYGVVIGSGCIAGYMLGAWALYIRMMVYVSMGLGTIGGILYWIWTIV